MTQANPTAADYLNRTVDVAAFSGQRPAGDTLLTAALADEGQGGLVVTGIVKLAQRWTMEFMTIRGTMAALPERGCDFFGQVARGELRTSLDASQAFYLSAEQVRTNLVAEETVEDPDDESYADVTLLAATVSGDKLTLRVQIESRAGTARTAILPFALKG